MEDVDGIHAPLYEAISHHLKRHACRFHIPGHKGMPGGPSDLLYYFGDQVLQADLTELPGLDDLHSPTGPIAEAQRLAAKAWGADFSYFLVNGCTAGVHAMILAACKPGKPVLIPRDAHRSAYAALVLSGAVPVYVVPEVEPRLGVPCGVDPLKIQTLLAKNPDISAVYVTYPTYHGFASDLEKIVELAHARHIPVLVDEAHGAHLAFSESGPPGAVKLKADMVVEGLHKTAGALGQCGLLNVTGSLVNVEHLETTLKLLQTTSPSYLLMASMDLARRHLQLWGSSLLRQVEALAKRAIEELSGLDGIECVTKEWLAQPAVKAVDTTKLTIYTGARRISGRELAARLSSKYGVDLEASAENWVLALLTFGDNDHTVSALVEGVRNALKELPPAYEVPTSAKKVEGFVLPVQAATPREAFYASKIRVPLSNALARIAGEFISPHPPGIPVVWPGELISRDVMCLIRELKRDGVKLHGPSDDSLDTLLVLK